MLYTTHVYLNWPLIPALKLLRFPIEYGKMLLADELITIVA